MNCLLWSDHAAQLLAQNETLRSAGLTNGATSGRNFVELEFGWDQIPAKDRRKVFKSRFEHRLSASAKNMRFPTISCIIKLAILINSNVFGQNLLRNASFEAVPTPALGQGILPSDWIQFSDALGQPQADTWSVDGSYGLSPEMYGHFTGAVAADGCRWAGGARTSAYYEGLSQCLSAPLISEQQYELRASLRLSAVNGLNASGGYRIYLSAFSNRFDKLILMGTLPAATSSMNWQDKLLTFIAPTNAEELSFFFLIPYVSQSGTNSYIAIDDLWLTNPGCCPPASIRLSQIEVCWPSRSNYLYQIDYRLDLNASQWTPLLTNIIGNGHTMCIGDRIICPTRFYRIVCPTNEAECFTAETLARPTLR